MKNNINISLSFKPLVRAIKKYHLTIFIVLVAAGLGYAVFTFANLLGESSTDSSYQSPIGAGTIDESTLERIKALHTSDEPTPELVVPAGRVNPFSE